MALVEILNVTMFSQNTQWLWGGSIDVPKPGSKTDVYAIDIVGWALGRKLPISAINIVQEGGSREVPLHLSRPDVTEHFPEVHGVESCGFWTKIGVLGMARESEILVEAVFEDGQHISLGVIQVRHQALHSSFQPTLQPIMITSLGRTGTTWLMRLLAEHPGIVVHQIYPFETRGASYWMHMLKVLSEPANHRQSSNPDDFHTNMWWTGHHPTYIESKLNHPQIKRWFGSDYIEHLAAFSQHAVESFYQQVAISQGQTETSYFAEKYHVGHIPRLIWELYPQAREIFLVRDFRDMICSMLAFNAKRGYISFGQRHVNSTNDFVQHTRHAALNLLREWKSRSAQSHMLRYEELILHPVETLHALLEYLNLDSTPSTIDAMLQRASAEKSELRKHQTSKNPMASIGRWQRDLDTPMQAACQEILDDVLQEFGYTEFDYASSGSKQVSEPALVDTLEAQS